MRIRSSIGLAVGPVDETHWGQVLVLPNAYGIIEIEDAGGRAQERGIAALSHLGEALSREITSLMMVQEVADTVFKSFVKSLVLLVPVGRVVYLVCKGVGEIYVKRGEELASLMHQEGGISGEVKERDTFLLVSHGFSQVLSHAELSMLFDHLPPAEIAEKLTLLLHEKKGGEGSVALVFGVTQLEESGLTETPQEEGEEKKIEEIPSVPFQEKVRRIVPVHISLTSAKRYAASLRHQPKKATAVLAIFLVSLFLLCVALGVMKQATTKKNQEVASAMSDAQHAFDEGVALLTLNPVKGRERLTTAKQLLDPYVQKVSGQTTEGHDLSVLYQKITDNLTQAMQVAQITLSPFYDVTLLKKGAVASSMAIDGSAVAIADQATGTVYSLDITSKNASIIGGGDTLANLSLVAIHADSYYALTKEGIVQIRASDKKSALVVKTNDAWGTISSVVSFGGNLYLLDTAKSRIWKYVATDTGFSDIREYLNPDTLPDLSQAVTMAIDGSVWLGTSNGKILRFTQGKENTFVSKGVDPTFGTKLAVYTSDNAKNVYVLDSQNNRVVVLDKEGMYLSQYRWKDAVTPSNLVVSEEEKKILLLSGGKIYSIDLK
jgi:hypothetical protein